MRLLRTLCAHFSRHRLPLSNFSLLPDMIPGVNAPVVQARVRGSAVTCSTLSTCPGFFDISFSAHLNRLRDMYEHVFEKLRADDRVPVAASPLASSASLLSSTGTCHFPFTEPYMCERRRIRLLPDALTCQGRPNQRISSTSFVQSSVTCCGGSCGQMGRLSHTMFRIVNRDIAVGSHHGRRRT